VAPPRSARATAGAAVALVLAAVLLWWALAGPRPPKAEIDRAALGLRVVEHHEAEGAAIPELVSVLDPQKVKQAMVGYQGAMGGRLSAPVPAGDGRYTATVVSGSEDDMDLESFVVGVVEWAGPGGDDYTRCSFAQPVPLDTAGAVASDQAGDVTADALSIVGRCDGSEPALYASLVRHEIADVDVVGGLLGRQADAVDVPAGVVEMRGADRTALHAEIDDPTDVAVYPRAVAEASFEHAFPDNPNADAGTWVEPIYPALAAADGRLLWVMPISPPDGPDAITGYATIAADEIAAGRFNPIDVYWLAEPHPGPTVLAGRTERLLRDIAPEASEGEVSIFLTLPDAEGAWQGRVARPAPIAGGDPEVLYFISVAADGEVCLRDLDDHEAGCLPPGDG
jgi:hypothetical protein